MPFDPDAYLASKTQGGDFNPDEYLKKFDPDAYLASKGSSKEVGLPAGLNPSDATDSYIRGGLNWMTGKHLPQIAGAVEHPIGALKTLTGGGTGHDVSADPDVQAYAKTRDQYKNLYDQAWNDHPVAYGAGAVTGAIMSPLNKLGVLPAAGIFAEGDSKADLTKGEVGQDVYDASKGVVTGAVLNKAFEKAAEAAAPYTQNLAQRLAVKHLRPTAKTAANLGPEKLNEIGQEALDSGAIKFGAKAEGTAARLDDLVNEVGAVKGDIVNASDAKINPIEIADKFDREVIQPLRGTAENEPVVRAMEAKKQAFLNQYAPGHNPSEVRAPGTPTTITRKAQFVPQEPTPIPTENVQVQTTMGGGKPISADPLTGAPSFEPGPLPSVGQSAETAENLAASLPFKTDPRTGLPIKQIVEKRLESVPEVPSMTPAQLEAEKTAVQGNINYNTDSSAKVGASKGWASVLRQSGEDAISDPAFVPAKESYGNLKAAQKMAQRTAGLAEGGTGLFGHMDDVAAGVVGAEGLLAGHPSALAIPAARALTKGRMLSAGAVTLDTLSKSLQANPQMFGRFAAPLAAAAARGGSSLASTHFVLGQQSPEYRQITENLQQQDPESTP